MDVETHEPKALQEATLSVDETRVFHRHTELVAPESGRDIGMALGIDVGVHAQRHSSLGPCGAGNCGNSIELTR